MMIDDCSYPGCGQEGKIDGFCAKHHMQKDKEQIVKMQGKTKQADELSCSKCGKKASEVKKFIKKIGMCKNCAYSPKKTHSAKFLHSPIPQIEKATATQDKMQKDMINNPPHYTTGKIEIIDFITDQDMGYLDGNIIKYVARYRHKGSAVDDLKKARWYLERLIEQVEDESR